VAKAESPRHSENLTHLNHGIHDDTANNHSPKPNNAMKNLVKIILVAAFSAAALQALAGPPPDYWQRMEASRKRAATAPTKPEPLCAICMELSKQSTPTAKVIRGRTYDPRLSCHRVLTPAAHAGGKGQSYTSECVCS
jgi:hypothetical protein